MGESGFIICTSVLALVFSSFTYTAEAREPSNITRAIGETNVFIPCPFEFRPTPPIWRINGVDYIYATLPSIYTLESSGLFINEVHGCLHEYTFQCIDSSGSEGRKSRVGVLTISSQFNCTGDVYDEFKEILQFCAECVELDHQNIMYESNSTELGWIVFTEHVQACNKSRIQAYPQCELENPFFDDSFYGTKIKADLPTSTFPLDLNMTVFSITNKIDQQTQQCPRLIVLPRFNVTETETTDVLLGNNGCTQVEVLCENIPSVAISTAEMERDVLCPTVVSGLGSCYDIESCNQYTLSAPFFTVCRNSNNTCLVTFNILNQTLNGTRLDFFMSNTYSAVCNLGFNNNNNRNVIRTYYRSFVVKVSAATANLSVKFPSKEICFSSSSLNCPLSNLTQYNVSVTDITGLVIFEQNKIADEQCIAVDKLIPICSPFAVSAQPFNEHIKYNPINKPIGLETDGDLCSCIQENIQLLFVISPLNSSAETTVDYICTTDYPSPIFVELIVNYSVVHKVPCGNGSLPISADDQCSMVTICSRWNSTVDCNLTNCTLVPVANSCNQEPTQSSNNLLPIILGSVIGVISFLLVTVTFAIVITCRYLRIQLKRRRRMINSMSNVGVSVLYKTDSDSVTISQSKTETT